MDKAKLKEVLERHLHWIKKDCDGWKDMRADLQYANLRGAYLQYADLRGAYLRDADLRGADLRGADLQYAYLQYADLQYADLQYADLQGADLQYADLQYADLQGADLQGADLRYAVLRGADLRGAKIEKKLIDKFFPICCPEHGSFIGYKQANGYIVKLQICEDAMRSSAFGRKCRCDKALVLNIENYDGSGSGLKEIASGFDSSFIYRIGEIVEVPNFDDDRTHECAPGIHFFITRQEAVDYYV